MFNIIENNQILIIRFGNQKQSSKEALISVQKFLINFVTYDNYQKLIRLENWVYFYLQDDEKNFQFALGIEDSQQYKIYNLMYFRIKVKLFYLLILKPFQGNCSQLSTLEAVTLMQLKKLDQAQQEIDRAIKLLELVKYRKDMFYLFYIKGCILYQQLKSIGLAQNKKYDKALTCFEKTIQQCSMFHKGQACKALMLQISQAYLLYFHKTNLNLQLNIFKPIFNSTPSAYPQYIILELHYKEQKEICKIVRSQSYEKAKEAFMSLNSYKQKDDNLIQYIQYIEQYYKQHNIKRLMKSLKVSQQKRTIIKILKFIKVILIVNSFFIIYKEQYTNSLSLLIIFKKTYKLNLLQFKFSIVYEVQLVKRIQQKLRRLQIIKQMDNLSNISVNLLSQIQNLIKLLLYCKSEYEESFTMIDKVQQIEGEKSKVIVNLLNALILNFKQILSRILKLQKQDEAQQFLDFIQHQIEKDQNKFYYQEIFQYVIIYSQPMLKYNNSINITKSKLQEHQEAQIQSLDFKKFVQKFLLNSFLFPIQLQDKLYSRIKQNKNGHPLVQNIETLEIDYEYIYPKKSKIDYWLLTVDYQLFIKDLWWLFNYDQKKQQN